ncbi:hypothetical protein HPB47_008872 [Ixodes persulcatus]|uniref:Uncharacterized protein n=1 Tax=Ixodes persulcatus TaxID=34615 RepID=A0AC60P401_IXOPE|nr:hypothetical protein HPB47_008872 [Ixodes persulcatus]
MLEVATQICENRERPRQAFDDAVCFVDESFEDHSSEIRDAIKSELSTHYGYASKRRALSRNRHFNVIRGNSLDTIFPELQTTKDGHRIHPFEDKTEAQIMLVFFAEKDMDALCDVQYVLGDGNYKYNPMEFHNPGQLYTLHAVVKGEARLVVYALMQSCDTRAYETFLKVVKDAMERKFGNVETLSTTATWIFDFELAAIQATKQVFGTAAGTPRRAGFLVETIDIPVPAEYLLLAEVAPVAELAELRETSLPRLSKRTAALACPSDDDEIVMDELVVVRDDLARACRVEGQRARGRSVVLVINFNDNGRNL